MAFILNFVKKTGDEILSYNGGTGVIPSHRGKRLTVSMYDFIIPLLKNSNVDTLKLEVLTQNIAAIKIYKQQGYKTVREVSFLRGSLAVTKEYVSKYRVEKLEALDWQRFTSFWDYPPTWQNSMNTMNKLKNQNVHLGILEGGIILGYLIYNPLLKRIHQMAIAKTHRNIGLGSMLLHYLVANIEEDISFLNIDTRCNLIGFLKKRGLSVLFNQFEMVKELNEE